MEEFSNWTTDMKRKLLETDKQIMSTATRTGADDPAYRAIREEVVNAVHSSPADKIPGETPFQSVQFARTERDEYVGEVGKRGGDYIFHFFPVSEFPAKFEDVMGDVFLEVFKFPERIQSAYSDELKSWAVKAVGFASNPLADDLAISIFDTLDRHLRPAS